MTKVFKVILLITIVGRIVLAFLGWHPDLNNHIDWGIRFFQYGPAKFYAPESNVWSFTWPNQPPGTIYMFAGIRKLYEGMFSFFSILHFKIGVFPGSWLLFFEKTLYPALLKLPAIICDIGIGYIIYKITNKKKALLLWLINPLIWYNSAVWGQYDSVINFFALLSFFFLLRKHLSFAVLTFAISLYIKASLLIFLPVFILVAIFQKNKLRDYLFSIIFSLLIIGVVTLPFSHGNVFSWLFNLYEKKVFVQQLHIITANAFNLWAAIAGIHEKPDTLPFLGLTYKYWSYILYFLFNIPILYSVVKNQSIKSVVRALALTAFSSFILLTNMHERYLYPLFPYLTIMVATSEVSGLFYWVVSVLSLLNLYNFWWFPRVDFIINFLSFGNRLMPRILGFINTVLFGWLYWGLLLKPLRTISSFGSNISKTLVRE